jgi:hypothetical protein
MGPFGGFVGIGTFELPNIFLKNFDSFSIEIGEDLALLNGRSK